ncbi:MAG: zinc-ribbon domain-containing protein [bacterium]|nr:MAG: zinc-ribbon domain-containing protein [bacterium]
MIVQCSQCQAKYRLDDDKVRRPGVRVRCAKCQNVFTVHPPDSPVQGGVASAAEGGILPSPSASESASPPLRTGETPDSGLPQPHEGPFSADGERPVPEPPPVEDGADGNIPLTDNGPLGRTELEFSGSGVADEAPGPSGDPSPAGDRPGQGAMEWGNIALGESGPLSEASGLDLTASADPQPTVPPLPDMPEPETPSPATEIPRPGRLTTTSLQGPSPAEKRTGKGLILLLFLAVLGAGGYFAYPKATEMIRDMTGKGPAVEKVQPKILDVQIGGLKRRDGVSLATVRGFVRNDTGQRIGIIRVVGTFKGIGGKILAESSSFCGNSLSEDELSTMSIDSIRSSMENELGKSLSNSSIEPGDSIPFLLVLVDPPAQIQEVTLKVESWQQTG